MRQWKQCCYQKGRSALSNQVPRRISYQSPSQEIAETGEDIGNRASLEKYPSSFYKQGNLCFLPANEIHNQVRHIYVPHLQISDYIQRFQSSITICLKLYVMHAFRDVGLLIITQRHSNDHQVKRHILVYGVFQRWTHHKTLPRELSFKEKNQSIS